ncbi:MAG: hypothetical protein M1833_004977 [Piccolia ochrophora]|nr:MAG: hypothetical protein M1833_004977 [Piccolia ochrophora]
MVFSNGEVRKSLHEQNPEQQLGSAISPQIAKPISKSSGYDTKTKDIPKPLDGPIQRAISQTARSAVPATSKALPRQEPRSASAKEGDMERHQGTKAPRASATSLKGNSLRDKVKFHPTSTTGRSHNAEHQRAPSTSMRSRLPSRDINEKFDLEASAVGRSTTGSQPELAQVDKRARPTFSTLQQNFTPKKSLKHPGIHLPSRSGISTSGSGSGTLDTVRSQVELLQLTVLHSASKDNFERWQESAKSDFRDRSHGIKSRLEGITRAEEELQRRKNLAALQLWVEDAPKCSELGIKAQLVGEVLQELVKLTDPQSKYVKVVDAFEVWLQYSRRVIASRHEDVEITDMPPELSFLEGLGDGWLADIEGASRRLETTKEQLDQIGEPLEGSTLAFITTTCAALKSSMADCLEVMVAVENKVMAYEQEWLDKMVADITDDVEQHQHHTGSALHSGKGIWEGS